MREVCEYICIACITVIMTLFTGVLLGFAVEEAVKKWRKK